MQTDRSNSSIGLVQIGITFLTLATALIHFYLSMMMGIDVLFTLNALGYIALLAALLIPLPILVRYRPIIRWVMILYTLLTIVLWIIMGDRDTLAYVDKLIEAALVVLLWMDRARYQ